MKILITHLNAVFIFEKIRNIRSDFLVPRNPLGVSESRCVDDGQRKWDSKSILVVDIVDCDSLGLTVGLRSSSDWLIDELETKWIVPFDSQDIIDHGVDPRRLSRPSGSHHQNCFAPFKYVEFA